AQPAPATAGNTVVPSPAAPGRQTGLASSAKSIEWHVERAPAPGLPRESAWVPPLIGGHGERAGAQPQSESVYVPPLIDWAGDGDGTDSVSGEGARAMAARAVVMH